MSDDHDPWNDESHRHPRAHQLMAPGLWDCADEDAPFGSDEGSDAYYEYRQWRAENPNAPLSACLAWIGDETDYPDTYTYDATIIATVLGQLVLDGRIDEDAKPAAIGAIDRQRLGADESRRTFLDDTEASIGAG